MHAGSSRSCETGRWSAVACARETRPVEAGPGLGRRRKRAHLTHPPPHLEDGAAAHTTCLEMISDAASEAQRIQIIAMAPECLPVTGRPAE